MTGSKSYLGNDQLHVGDSKGLIISNTTHTTIHTPKHIFTLFNVLYMPQVKKKKPLLSIQQFCCENPFFLISLICFLC
jgi:hypothetical protein